LSLKNFQLPTSRFQPKSLSLLNRKNNQDMNKPITEFIEKYYLHFNAAALVDASKGYRPFKGWRKNADFTCRSNVHCRTRKDFGGDDSSG
jgi:hypothetical protein